MKQVALTTRTYTTTPRSTAIVWDMCLTFLSFVGKISICLSVITARMSRHIGRFYWQHKMRFCIDVVALTLFVAMSIAGYTMHQKTIDAQMTEEVVSGIDQYTPAGSKRTFSRSDAAASAREFMNAGADTWLRHITIQTIFTEARKARLGNTETAVLLGIAAIESGFNPFAKAPTTTACGTYQFIRATGTQYGVSDETCFNPTRNARAQVKHFHAIIGQPTVQRELHGKDVTQRLVTMFKEVYCRHHDGVHMRVCSQLAKSLTADNLPMLFGAYNVLTAAQAHAEQASFLHVVYRVLDTMYTNTTALVSSIVM
jgi:Transglycosylase SLT domain